MNICYVIADPEIGGAEKYALALAGEAKKSGHKVYFIIGRKGPLINEFRIYNFEFRIIPMQTSFNPFAVIKSTFALRKYFKGNGIEVVHTQMLREHSIAILAKMMGARISIVRTFHRLDQFNWKMRPLMWFYRRQTDAFIVATQYVRNYLSENSIKNKVYVIENGVPSVIPTEVEGSLDEVPERGRRTREDKPKAFGFLGRVVPEKGILQFVRESAYSFKGEEKLLIAGEGPEMDELKKITKNNENIKILGPTNDISDFFSKISVLVLPSKTEVMPLSVLEAYSAGIPVVTFDLESLKEVVPAVAGLRTPAYDYRKMAEETIKLLKNQGLLAKMSENARKLYKEKYTVEKMWQKTKKLYLKLLS